MKTKISFILVVLVAIMTWSPIMGLAADLVTNGDTAYQIVLSAHVDDSTKAVVSDMVNILNEISGAAFRVVPDTTGPGDHEIIIGHDNARLEGLDLADMTKDFVQGEYENRTVGEHLVIAGAPPGARSTRYTDSFRIT